MTKPTWTRVAATEVIDGDIVINYGYRCRASQCRYHFAGDGVRVRSFVLTSEPSVTHPDVLPRGFSGQWYGGSQGATYWREVAAEAAGEQTN